MEEQDALIVKLLTLVDEYEQLANGEYRSLFIDGYMALSRANFNAHKTFGVENYDMSAHEAVLQIQQLDGLLTVLDKVQEARKIQEAKAIQEKQKITKNSKENEQKLEKEPKVNEQIVDKSSSKKSKAKQVTRQSLSTAISSHKSTSSEKPTVKTIETPVKIKDPINQFGGLVPYHLKSAQDSFKNSIINAIALLNIQVQISAIVDKLSRPEQTNKLDT